MTGTSCGTVQTITFDPGNICGPNGSADCAATWVKVTGPDLACWEHDSGGPVFSGGIAYGIVQSGGNPSGTGHGQCPNIAFMSINYISNLGILTLKA